MKNKLFIIVASLALFAAGTALAQNAGDGQEQKSDKPAVQTDAIFDERV